MAGKIGTLPMCTPVLKKRSSGTRASWSGTTWSPKMRKNSALLPRNGIHASAYAAMVASASGNSVPGIETTREFTKYGINPPWTLYPPETSTVL